MDPFPAKIVAASAGSTLTALTMTPFDVVKTRLQTQPDAPRRTPLFPRPPSQACCQPTKVGCVRNMSSLARSVAAEDMVCVWDRGVMRTEKVNGFFDGFRHVWRAEGMKGLWKGAGTAWLIGVPSSTCYMLTYDYLVRVVMPSISPSSTLVPLLAGITARTSITTLVSPLELVRTNLQSTPLSPNTPHTLRSVLTSLRSLTREHGLRSLWRGLGSTLWRDVPFSGIYWASYEGLKSALERRGRKGAWVAFISGATSGTMASLCTGPFDVVKTRRQALLMSTPSAAPSTKSSLGIIAYILRKEGVSALFAGIVPRTVKIAPACGIMIASFEGFGKLLTKKDIDL